MNTIIRICNEIHPVSGIEGCSLAETTFQHYLLLNNNKNFNMIIFSRPFSKTTLRKYKARDNYEVLSSLLRDNYGYRNIIEDKPVANRLRRDIFFIDTNIVEKICYFFVRKSILKSLFYPLMSLVYHVRISMILKKIRIEKGIVHLFNRPLAFLFPKSKQLSYLLDIQNSHFSVKNAFVQSLINKAIRGFDRVVFVSMFLKNEYGPKNPKIPKQVVINYGLSLIHQNLGTNINLLLDSTVNISKWKSQFFGNISHIKTDRVIRVLFVARIVPQKGLHFLLDALQKIVEEKEVKSLLETNNSYIELRVVGTPLFAKETYSSYFDSILKKINRSNGDYFRVLYLGYLDKVQLSREYIISDTVVVPSLWEEPLGLVNIEGMFFYNVVISSRAGGIPEIISSSEDGYLFEKGNQKELADILRSTINKIFNDDSSLKKIVKRAHLKVNKKFLMEQNFRNFLKVYKDTIYHP